MEIPHNALVVVMDGKKLLLLQNDGTAASAHLTVLAKAEQDTPPSREIASDRQGRAFESSGSRRSSYDEADFHQLAEDRFAADAAAMLEKLALAGDFERLIVTAPARTLGELRDHYHGEVAKRIVGEIDKDFTKHTLPEIARLISES